MYSISTPASREEGSFSESGWIDNVGKPMEPDAIDKDDGITAVDKATTFLVEQGAMEPSNFPWSPDTSYINHKYEEDLSTGEVEERSYHLVDFSEEEEKEIYEIMQRGGSM